MKINQGKTEAELVVELVYLLMVKAGEAFSSDTDRGMVTYQEYMEATMNILEQFNNKINSGAQVDLSENTARALLDLGRVSVLQ